MANREINRPAKAAKSAPAKVSDTGDPADGGLTANAVPSGANDALIPVQGRRLEPGEKPFPAAPPVRDEQGQRELIETTTKDQVLAFAPQATDELPERDDLCVVEGCQWTRTGSDLICSSHAISHYRDGRPRGEVRTDDQREGHYAVEKTPHHQGHILRHVETPGRVATEVAPGAVESERDGRDD